MSVYINKSRSSGVKDCDNNIETNLVLKHKTLHFILKISFVVSRSTKTGLEIFRVR
jgi:hypothetical protein